MLTSVSVVTVLLAFILGMALGRARFRYLAARGASMPEPPAELPAWPADDVVDTQVLDILLHELRSPLAGIIGASDLLKEGLAGPLAEEQLYFLEKVLRQADAMQGLLNDLIDLRRAQIGKLQLIPRWILPVQLVEDVILDFKSTALHAEIRLVNGVPADLRPVWGDPARLRQVLTNLLTNALKFTPAGGRVEVRARLEEGELRVEVRDTGIGLSEDEQRQLFERYWQLDAAREKGGLGLGLPICKLLVEAHGGRIGVESAPGRGSTFYFMVPVEAPHGMPPEWRLWDPFRAE